MKSKNENKAHFILLIMACTFSVILIGRFIINKNTIYNPTPSTHIQLIDRSSNEIVYLEIIEKNKIEPLKDILEDKSLTKVPKIYYENTLYHQNPNFLIWTILILIMLGIAGGSIPIFIAKIIELKHAFSLNPFNILLAFFSSIVLLLFVFFLFVLQEGNYQPTKLVDDFQILLSGWVIRWIVIVTLVFQIPIFLTVFLIGPAADKIRLKLKENQEIKDAKEKFLELESTLKKCVQVLAILIVFSVLTSFALGQSIKATIEVKEFNIFPDEISYAYGLFFSLFLGLMYIPTHIYLKYKGVLFIKELETIKKNEPSEKRISWLTEIKNGFTLELSAIENLKIALTVIAPIITSFLPEHFNFL